MQRVTADQGSQPHFGDVRVGIVRAGLKQDVPTARLAIRTPQSQRVVDVGVGETVDVPDRGSITVLDVHRRLEPSRRDSVTLAWQDAALDAGLDAGS